jgi:predicted ribosomally synthesized peptide with nif11-like leader
MTAVLTTTKTTSLEQFYQEVLGDVTLQERLKAATSSEDLVEIALQLGAEKGYSFTKEEVVAAMAIESTFEEEDLDLHTGPMACCSRCADLYS